MTIQLYHCKGARSLRPVWTLEEMGIDYDLHVLPFPPRVFKKDYLGTNVLGTVPYMIDGDVHMTESSGMAKYLVDRYGPTPIAVDVDDPEYGAFLNWLFFSDATLTFPQTLFLRYTRLEPEERRVPQVAEDLPQVVPGPVAAGGEGDLGRARFPVLRQVHDRRHLRRLRAAPGDIARHRRLRRQRAALLDAVAGSSLLPADSRGVRAWAAERPVGCSWR